MRKHLLIPLALLYSGWTIAAPINRSGHSDNSPASPWYQADLVVFRYVTDNSGEAWPPTGKQRPLEGITLKPATTLEEQAALFKLPGKTAPEQSPVDPVRDAFVSLPDSDRLLNKEADRLSQNRRYQILMQKAWRMPVGPENQKQPVRLTASSDNTDGYLLDGTISISEERFLHVDVDLWFNKLSPEQLYSTLKGGDASQPPLQPSTQGEQLVIEPKSGHLIQRQAGASPLRITDNFQLKQRRRIRNTDEIQYLDSPVIGVLFKLTPYERPETLLEVPATPAES